MMPSQAWAQGASTDEGRLEEIVVTAQKREQSVMDVPVAVSAVSGDALLANRVTNVTDLSSLAPGVTVRVSAGGSALPSFTVRGAVSYGVVPGSDKEVSIYLDGVYLASPRGSIFDMPDVQRIEMLRGPQGTLFGRNATAGAVSITTRDPKDHFSAKVSGTVANQDGWRVQGTVDTGQIGPFSAYFSYVHNYRRGDIMNARPGQVWDRSASLVHPTIKSSSQWLGTKDSDTFFAALKFESGNFRTVYKFDYYKAGKDQTPEGTALVGINTAAPLTGALINTLVTSQAIPAHFAPDARRPAIVDNAFVVPTDQTNQGHNLTSTLDLGSVKIKNIFAYRKSYIFAASSIDGFSSLPFTAQTIAPYATFIAFSRGLVNASTPLAQLQATIGSVAAGLTPLVGQPFNTITAQTGTESKQYSDELQVNYDSHFLTLTAGGIWLHSEDRVNEHGLANGVNFAPVVNGVLGLGLNFALPKTTSIAAYAQAELHLSPKFDVILGGRVTHDSKKSTFSFGSVNAPTVINSTYSETRPSFLIGVNYKPNADTLIYAKYSTAYVSGGSSAAVDFQPETAKSVEGGIKAELLDRKLRTSLAVFWAKYKNYQSAQGASTFGSAVGQLLAGKVDAALIPSLITNMGTFVLNQGDVEAKGFELDLSAAPARGFTLGGSLSYTDTTFSNVPTLLLTSLTIPADHPEYFNSPYRPKWTANLYGQYDSRPLFGDAYLSLRMDANFQSAMPLDADTHRGIETPVFAPLKENPAYWVVNGRAALRNIAIGPLKGEVALWGKNLFDENKISFALINANAEASANFIPARSFGVDLTLEF